jgi:predicted anti-sigma-YlaC factor YlaD
MMQHLTTETLIDYIHAELAPAEDALVHTHLQTCGLCRSEYERETRLSDALRLAARESEQELPGMVKALIWEAVRAERPTLSARLAALLRPAVAVPALAVLLVATYFTSPLGHQQAAARMVDATYYLEQHAAEELQNPLGERNVSSPILETTETANTDSSLGTRTAAAAALDAVE